MDDVREQKTSPKKPRKTYLPETTMALKPGEDPNDFNAGASESTEAAVRADSSTEPQKEPEPVNQERLEVKLEAAEKAEDRQRPLPPNPVNPMIGEDGVLLSQTFNEEWKIASMMASSEMVPDHFRGKPAAVMMAMQTARSRGLNPLTAIQSMANIFGRTQGYGELPLAETFASKKLKFFKEFWIDKDGSAIDESDIKTPVFGCVTIAEAHDSPQGRVMRIFTMEDAKTAGLLEDPKRKTWRQYWKRMLQMRSRGWCLKDTVPEVTAGIEMPGYDEHADEITLKTSPTDNLAERLTQRIIGVTDAKEAVPN